MLPNHRPRLKRQEPLFQRDWIREHGEDFKEWIGDKPFLFCAGNHDYYNEICSELCDLKINAIDITNKIVEIDGKKFYGFPYVPYIGVWNWELIEKDMRTKVQELVDIINMFKIDVLVAHCPPYGILDMNHEGHHIGNVAMSNAMSFNFKHIPKLYLCGHCHGDNGIYNIPLGLNKDYMLISNAATTQRIVEIK
jgi:Icc-related predicted phosphoesterase